MAQNSRDISLIDPLRQLTLLRRLILSANVKHNALVLAANILAGLFGYLLHAVLGRLMGLGAYGAVASLIALSSILLIPTQVITAVVARHASNLGASNASQLNSLIRRLTLILLPVGIIVTVLFLGSSALISQFFHLGTVHGVLLMSLTFIVAFVAPINMGVVQGLQRFSWYAVLVVTPVLLRFVLAGILVAIGFGVDGAVMGIVLSAFLAYFISFKPLAPLLRGPREHSGALRSLWGYAATSTIAIGCINLLYNLDILLAKHFLDVKHAGLYAGLATVGKIVLVVSNSVVMVMFPKFAALHSQGKRLTPALAEALFGVGILSLLVELVFCVAPALILRLSIGSSFTAEAGQLSWYGLAMLLFALAQVFVYYFLAIGNRIFTVAVLLCCIAQCILFSVRHQSVEQLVQAVIVAKVALILALVALFFLSQYRQRVECMALKGSNNL